MVRGKLTKAPSGEPALQTSDGSFVTLAGDPDTIGVLKDARLANADFEVVGQSLRRRSLHHQPYPQTSAFQLQEWPPAHGDLLVRRLRDPDLYSRHLLVLPRGDRARSHRA